MLRQVPALAQERTLYIINMISTSCQTLLMQGILLLTGMGTKQTLDAMIEILTATRKVKPEIYQNITNWIWFSPWWLMYGDALWMLAGDDGMNGTGLKFLREQWLPLTGIRIYGAWGNPADRPACSSVTRL